jgi:hypothetical protein
MPKMNSRPKRKTVHSAPMGSPLERECARHLAQLRQVSDEADLQVANGVHADRIENLKG